MATNTINNTTTPNTSDKQAVLPLILIIPVVVGAVAGTGAAVGGASTATAIGVGVAGGVISGMIVWGASRELDRQMRSGDLVRDLNGAMNESQKKEFNSKIQNINKQINRINDLEAKGNKSVGAILRKDLAKSYTGLTNLIDNILPNVRTGSAVKDFSESLKGSRASIINGANMNVVQDLKLSNNLNQSTQIATNPSPSDYNDLQSKSNKESLGIVNPDYSSSEPQVSKVNQELAKIMIASGLNPNEPNDIEKFSEGVSKGEYDKDISNIQSNNSQKQKDVEYQR
jgi:hypothetical protein